jgi:hypothetical protein
VRRKQLAPVTLHKRLAKAPVAPDRPIPKTNARSAPDFQPGISMPQPTRNSIIPRRKSRSCRPCNGTRAVRTITGVQRLEPPGPVGAECSPIPTIRTMTDDEILNDPVFGEAFDVALRDPDLIDDVIAWRERIFEALESPSLARLLVTAAEDLIAKHSGGIQ